MDKNQIADILLNTKVVEIRPKNPFTFASGIKSPIYCDNRRLISHHSERSVIVSAFVERIREHGIPDYIAATATAGIPWGAWIADRLELPLLYVRSSAKSHGKENLIEGSYEEGKKAVVVEDLISSGGSSLNSVHNLREAGFYVDSIYSIFTYNMCNAINKFKSEEIHAWPILGLSELLDHARHKGLLTKEELVLVLEWARDPGDWINNNPHLK